MIEFLLICVLIALLFGADGLFSALGCLLQVILMLAALAFLVAVLIRP